jgi:SAM-dependent methyltransferase
VISGEEFVSVNYDQVAGKYDRRYDQNAYAGVEHSVGAFVESAHGPVVLEVGCGTGHWLKTLRTRSLQVFGIDTSRGMLERARLAAPGAILVQAAAEALPWRSYYFDRVLCVNALHHFTAPDEFFREAHRVLRPGAAVLIVGLDPHLGSDEWWIYEYFPGARERDRARYPATESIRRMMIAAGFGSCRTEEVQHFPARVPLRSAMTRGLLDRESTSQLMILPNDEYEEGLRRILKAQREHGDTDLMLRANLRLYGTVGQVVDS